MYLINDKIPEKLIINESEFISNKIEDDNLLLITSTEKLSQKYNIRLLRYTKKAFHNTDIYSFNSFIKSQYKFLYGKVLIDEIVENELIIQSLERCNDLFQHRSNNYNYISQISSIIKGLREDGIRAKNLREDLYDQIDKYPHDNEKLSDLVKIMENYEALLTELEVVDHPLAMEFITTGINKDKIINGKTILLSHFINFRKPDIELIDALSKAGNTIIITTNTNKITGPYLGKDNFFLNDLKDIGFKLFDEENNEIDYKLFEIENELGFELSTIKLAESKEKKFNLVSYSNIREEVYAVTKLVKYLLLDDKYKLSPSDICVVSRNVSAYSLLIGEFFADNKIPANITDRFELSKSPVVIGIINVLETVLNNFSTESLRKVLDSAFLDTGIKKSKHILYLAKKYRITNVVPEKGLFTFITLISMRLQNIENSIKTSESNNSNISRSIYREKEELGQMILDFNLLHQKFIKINKNKDYSIEEFVSVIHNIINEFKIRNKILELNDMINSNNLSFNERVFYSEKIEKDARGLYKFIELLKNLKTINQFTIKEKYPLAELVEKLKGIVSITRYQIREKKGFGVDVTSLEQTRGYDYKVKILVGAIEGMLPINFQTDRLIGKLIQDSERRHYFQEYIQFFDFIKDDVEYYIFSHREENSELKINSHFVTPIENNIYSNSYNEKSNLDWQNSILNKREDILYGIDKTSTNIEKRSYNFKNSSDLEVKINKLTNLESQKVFQNVYSDTEIERFKNYAFNYFYEKLLKLENLPNIEIFLTNLEIGSILHKSVEETFKIYVNNNNSCIKNIISNKDKTKSLKLIKLTKLDKPKILELFKITSLEKIRAFQSQHQFYDIDELLLIGNQKQDGILIKWFENTIDRHLEDNYNILANEFQFDNIEISTLDYKAKFRGKIDRIDISDNLKSYKIIDYKLRDGNRDGMQLAIYSKAIQFILLNEYDILSEPCGLIYNSFRYKFDDKETMGYKEILNNPKKGAFELIEPLIEKAFELIEQMENLDFSKVKNGKNYFRDKSMDLLKRD